MLHEGEDAARSKNTPNFRQHDRRIRNRAQRKEAYDGIKVGMWKGQGASRRLHNFGWNASRRCSRQKRRVVIEVRLYAPPSDGSRKMAKAWICTWTDFENVTLEASQQNALTFRDRALTSLVESRQQPTLDISTPEWHGHFPSTL